MWLEQTRLKIDKVAYIDEAGKALKDDIPVTSDGLIEMYKWMVLARVFDVRAIKLQRQGRIGTYAPLQGQEAAQIGSAFALRESDWIYPSYRELGASIVRGFPMSQFFLYSLGHLQALAVEKTNVFPIQIIIGAQCLHAVGGAWASQYNDEDSVSVAYIGDGGTSEGDFHEALNFAGVYKLPIIFFVQNNQWAISVPVSKQTASKSIAQKALAYGISGIQVDGNDAVAVYLTMKEAIERAKVGEPVLIEAVTFRQGAHTTADDPTKYRMENEVKEWESKDPLKRLKSYIISLGIWDEEQDKNAYDTADNEVTEAFEEAQEVPKTLLEEAFEHVYENMTVQLKEQQSQVSEGSQR